MAGPEKVARTRFRVSACGEAALVFLQLLAREIACGARGGGVRGLGLRRRGNCFCPNPQPAPDTHSSPSTSYFFGQKLQEDQNGLSTARNTKTRSCNYGCNFFLPKPPASPSGKVPDPGPSSQPTASSSPGRGHPLLSRILFHISILY